jgi:1,4-dihydroxy-2-naphthoate octaprenyltransferase
MTYRTFLELVEIRTKLASLFPFIMGVLFAMTYFGEVQWLNTFIFFIGMTIFDMVTTMINNYMDLKKLNPKPIRLDRKYHWTIKHPTQACASSHFYHALDDDGTLASI